MPEAASSVFASLGSYGVQGTLVARYQAVFAGGIIVQLACARPMETTLFSAPRPIASSNACGVFGLDASGLSMVEYGRRPTPLRLPRLITMPLQPSRGAWITRKFELFRTPSSSAASTLSSTSMSPAFSAAAAAAAPADPAGTG